MKWTNGDVEMVEKFIDIKNRGYYVDSRQLQNVYNRVLEKQVQPTNCGSCLRSRVQELENALNEFKKQMSLSGLTSADEYNNEIAAIKEETEAYNKVEAPTEEIKEAKKVRKPKKNKE